MWKISPPTGIRSLDRPARSQSLYRRRYPAHIYVCMVSRLKKTKLYQKYQTGHILQSEKPHLTHRPNVLCSSSNKSWNTLSTLYSRGPQISHQCRSHLKIVGTRKVTWSKYQIQDPETFGSTIHNLVTQDLYTPAVQICETEHTLQLSKFPTSVKSQTWVPHTVNYGDYYLLGSDVKIHGHCRGTCCLHFCGRKNMKASIRFLWNKKYLPDYTASHPTRQQ